MEPHSITHRFEWEDQYIMPTEVLQHRKQALQSIAMCFAGVQCIFII